MSKKVFLTSDGFSFHTIELRWNPTDAVFDGQNFVFSSIGLPQ